MMRTRLYADDAGLQLSEKPQHLRPLYLPTKGDLAFPVDAVDLKYRLRNIETNGGNRLHVCLRQILLA